MQILDGLSASGFEQALTRIAYQGQRLLLDTPETIATTNNNAIVYGYMFGIGFGLPVLVAIVLGICYWANNMGGGNTKPTPQTNFDKYLAELNSRSASSFIMSNNNAHQRRAQSQMPSAPTAVQQSKFAKLAPAVDAITYQNQISAMQMAAFIKHVANMNGGGGRPVK